MSSLTISLLPLVRLAPPFALSGETLPAPERLNFLCERTAAPVLVAERTTTQVLTLGHPMITPQPISHPVQVDLPVLRFWAKTSLSGLDLTFCITDAHGTPEVTKTSLDVGSGTKSDGTPGYYCEVDLSQGESYGLSVSDDRRYSIRDSQTLGDRDVLAFGPWIVFDVP